MDASPVAGWENFCVIVGSSAGGLTGLGLGGLAGVIYGGFIAVNMHRRS